MTVNNSDIDRLLNELTLNEKISLLGGFNFKQTTEIERLNIPGVTISDGPNGIRGKRIFGATPSSCLPCGTGLASTFNKDLVLGAGKLMSDEAKAKGVHCVLGPTCNMVRGPLGGRDFESFSEDPNLSGIMTAAFINGLQLEGVISCLKHYVCNDQEKDRNGLDTIVTERALREIYLKPFQIAVRDSKPKAMMISYNKVNGVAVTQSKKLLLDVLRSEWKWDGLTMSDWFATYSTKDAIDAGLNLEMPGPPKFRQPVQTSHLVSVNEIHIDAIDENVRSVIKFALSSLESGITKDQLETENKDPSVPDLLRRLATESIVLLKNEDSLLPLSAERKVGNEIIAVIGPNAKEERNSGGGSAVVKTRYTVTPYDGIVKKVKEQAGDNAVVVDYTLGAFLNKTLPDIGRILTLENGEKGTTIKFFLDPPGTPNREPFDTVYSDTTRLFLPDYRHEKMEPGSDLYYGDIEGYFAPEETSDYEFGCSCLGTAQMFLDDKLIVDNKTKQVRGDAYFLAMGTREERGRVHLEKGRRYKLRVEFGTRPSSNLITPFHETGGVYFGAEIKTADEEALRKAVEVAKKADKVILVTGLSRDWESEGYDRADMKVPGRTDKMISEVAKVNKNVVVVNQSGSPVAMPWANDVKAIIQAWYGGNELGTAIADVLFGDENPSGKLSLSFPEKLEHNPTFFNFGSVNGRVLYGEDVFVGYKYYEMADRKPLFPFGHGLSYTTFDFKNPSVEIEGEDIVALVDVTNTGKRNGSAVVQLYVKAHNPRIIRPEKELRNFGKVFLKGAETKTVTIKTALLEATSYWDSYKNKWLSEKDTYSVLFGTSSDNIVCEGTITTKEDKYWLGL